MYCGSSNSTSMLRAAVGFKSGKEMEISPFSSVFFFPLSFYFSVYDKPIPDCCVLKNLLGIAGKLDFLLYNGYRPLVDIRCLKGWCYLWSFRFSDYVNRRIPVLHSTSSYCILAGSNHRRGG